MLEHETQSHFRLNHLAVLLGFLDGQGVLVEAYSWDWRTIVAVSQGLQPKLWSWVMIGTKNGNCLIELISASCSHKSKSSGVKGGDH